jgi:hypothetical protein
MPKRVVPQVRQNVDDPFVRHVIPFANAPCRLQSTCRCQPNGAIRQKLLPKNGEWRMSKLMKTGAKVGALKITRSWRGARDDSRAPA